MIWWNLVLWAFSFVATALLAPKPKIENAKAQGLGDIDFPRAGEGFPVTKVYGRSKVAGPNTLWFGDFAAVPITERVRTGLFSKKTVTTGYRYQIGFDLALCLGPSITLHKITVDKDALWEGTVNTQTTITINQESLFGGPKEGGGMSGTIEFYPGSFTQTASSYLDSQLGETVPAYLGICHAVFRSFYIGTSANLRQMSFEVSCYTNSLGLTSGREKIGVDANPFEVLYDVLVTKFGGMSVASSLININSFRDAANTLYTEVNGISVTVDGQNSFRDFALEVLRQVDGIIYQDPETGLIEAKLIRNDYDLENLPVLDETDIIGVPNIAKSMWSETFNQIRLVYKSRLRDYEDSASYAEDMANISFQGRPKPTQVNFPLCKNDSLAPYLAFRELSKLMVPIFSGSLTTNRRAAQMKPGDAFILNFPKYGIENKVLRVQRFNSGTIVDGRVRMEVFEDAFSVNAAIYAGTVTPGLPPPTVAPVEIEECEIFELPAFITTRQQEVQLYYNYHSEMNETYYSVENAELLVAFAIRPALNTSNYDIVYNGQFYGVSTETVEYVPNARVAVEIDEFDGFVDGYTTITVGNFYRPVETQLLADARQGQNLMFIGDELMIYTDVVNNGNGTYDLTVHRAVLDTQARTHPVDEKVFFMNNIDPMINSLIQIGSTVSVKPIGIFGGKRRLDAADQRSFEKVVERRRDLPISPDYLRIDGERIQDFSLVPGQEVTLSWRIRSAAQDQIALLTDDSLIANTEEVYVIELMTGESTVHQTYTSPHGAVTSGTFTVPAEMPFGPAYFRMRTRNSSGTPFSRSAEIYPVRIIEGYIALSGDASDGDDVLLLSGDETGKLLYKES